MGDPSGSPGSTGQDKNEKRVVKNGKKKRD